MDPVDALHPSLRLRRTGGNDANPQLLTHAPKLRHRNFSPQLLGLGRLSLVHVLPIGIESAALHTSQSTPATLPLPPRWSLLCPNGPASCSWHRLPCPSGNPPDHALPAETSRVCCDSRAGRHYHASALGCPPVDTAATVSSPGDNSVPA